MTHLTLNTGHVANPPAPPAEIVEMLQGLVAAGGGPVPQFAPWRVEITLGEHRSGVFTIYRGREPVCMCAVAGGASEGRHIWESIEGVYLQLSDSAPGLMAATAAPEMPQGAPWLAVLLLPSLALASREDISWLGDFEHCLAHAITARNQDLGTDSHSEPRRK